MQNLFLRRGYCMKKPKTYEEAVLQLEQLLEQISDTQTPLEQSIKLYAQAVTLLDVCSQKLQQATLQIEEIDQKLAAGAQPANSAEGE